MSTAPLDKITPVFFSSRSAQANFAAPDAVLIQTPGWGVETPPLSLSSLSSFGRTNGYRILALDLNIEHYTLRTEKYAHIWDIDQSQWFWNNINCVNEYFENHRELFEKHVEAILATDAPLICFSVYASCVESSFIYARLLKVRRPELKIVFGGPHASLNMAGDYILTHAYVDAIALGEGEFIFLDLLKRSVERASFADVPGVVWRDETGNIINNGKAEPIRELSKLPFSDFSDFELALYTKPDRLPLMSSRGCPNQCIYCSEKVFWDTYRGYGAKRIVDEIEYQKNLNPAFYHVDFQDSLVNGSIKRLEQFADELIARKTQITWAGQAVIRKEMTLELFKKLKQSGCVCLAYGLETSTTSLMMSIGKILSKGTEIDRLVSEAREAGLDCSYNFMFGMPGETDDDARASLDFLRRHRDNVGVVNPSAAFCGFTPGTPGYDEPENFGIIPSPTRDQYWETLDGTNNLLVRLRRFEDFCKLSVELGVRTTYPHAKLLDRDRLIGNYYHHMRQYDLAGPYFEAWLEKTPNDEEIKYKLQDCRLKTPDTEISIHPPHANLAPAP